MNTCLNMRNFFKEKYSQATDFYALYCNFDFQLEGQTEVVIKKKKNQNIVILIYFSSVWTKKKKKTKRRFWNWNVSSDLKKKICFLEKIISFQFAKIENK